MRLVFGLVICLAIGQPLMAQWDNGSCPVGQGEVRVKALDDPYGRELVWSGDKLQGAIDPRTGHWWAWDEATRSWGQERECRDCPEWKVDGCHSDKVHPDKFSVGGVETDPREFFSAGALPSDETGKSYVCCVGDEKFIAEAKSLFAPGGKCADWTDKVVIGFFAPSDWQVRGVGANKPGVTILGKRGPDERAKALHYQRDLTGLETALPLALREPDPSFDPSKVPDLRASDSPVPSWDGIEIPSNCIVTFGIMAALSYFIFNKKDK